MSKFLLLTTAVVLANVMHGAFAQVSCMYIVGQENCTAATNCFYNTASLKCEETPCTRILNLTQCGAYARCKVAYGNSAAGGASGSAAAFCVDKPCAEIPTSSCQGYPRCQVASNGCVNKPCDTFQGYGSSLTCPYPLCSGPVAVSPTNPNATTCKAMNFTGWPADQCPTYTGLWVVEYGYCMPAECSRFNSTVCDTRPSCVIDRAGVNLRCINRVLLSILPCSAFAAFPGMCALISSRCTVQDVTPTNCVPKIQQNSTLNCNALNTTAACTNNVNCQWAFDRCINPNCKLYTPTSANPSTNLCASQGCVIANFSWLAFPRLECVDPTFRNWPCEAYTNADYCLPGKCKFNATLGTCSAYSYTPTSTTPTAPTSQADICRLLTSDGDCNNNPNCLWYRLNATAAGSNTLLGVCIAMPCMQYQTGCPEQRCRNVDGKCWPQCPDGYVYCGQSQRCARSSDLCAPCQRSTDTQCWDSQCAPSEPQCPMCPPWRANRCRTGLIGLCVADLTKCTASCGNNSVTCPDLSCKPTQAECGCATTQYTCPAGSPVKCAPTAAACAIATCPASAPVPCTATGGCAASASGCGCGGDKPYKCDTPNGPVCMRSYETCPCYNYATNSSSGASPAVQLVRCDEKRCALTLAACTNTCGDNFVQCPDSTCQRTRDLCGCDQSTATLSVAIQAQIEGTFDVSRDLFVGSRVSKTLCSKITDQPNATVLWTVSNSAGVALSYKGRALQMMGRQLALPAGVLSPGMTVQISAVANLGNLQAAAIIYIRTVAPTPILNFIGGNRRIQAGTPLSLAVEIKDPLFNNVTDTVAWSCCADNQCMTTCFDDIARTTVRYVNIRTVAAGTYWFFASYKGVTVNGTVTAVAIAIPKVVINAPRPLGVLDEAVVFFATVEYNAPVSINWYINGSLLSQGSNVSRVPRSRFYQGTVWIINVVVTDLANAAAVGTNSIVFRVPKFLEGSCTITAASAFGDAQQAAIAGSSRLTIASTWPTTDDVLKYRFFFGQVSPNGLTASSATLRPILPYASELPSTDDVNTPLSDKNASVTLYVTVLARLASTESDVGIARCWITVNPNTAAAKTIAADRIATMNAARTTGDTRATSDAVADLATVISDPTVNRTQATSAGLSSLSAVVAARAADANAAGFSQIEKATLVSSMEKLASANAAAVTANAVPSVAGLSSDSTRLKNPDDVAAVLAVVNRVVAKDSEQTALNTKTDGAATARLLATVEPSKDVLLAADQLAKRVAEQADSGVETRLDADGVKVVGVRIDKSAATSASTTLGDVAQTGVQVQLPTNIPAIVDAPEGSEVKLSATTVRGNSLGTDAGLATKEQFATDTAEISLSVGSDSDGSTSTTVSTLSAAAEFRIKLSDTTPDPTADTVFRCRTFDKTNNVWTNDANVRFKYYDAVARCIVCETLHFSTFGGTMENPPTACNNITVKDNCTLPRCWFNESARLCQDAPCRQLPRETCSMNAKCYFVDASASGSANAAGTSGDASLALTGCIDKPCSMVEVQQCSQLYPRCMVAPDPLNPNNTVCRPRSCREFGSAAACPAPLCAWKLPLTGASGTTSPNLMATCQAVDYTQLPISACPTMTNEWMATEFGCVPKFCTRITNQSVCLQYKNDCFYQAPTPGANYPSCLPIALQSMAPCRAFTYATCTQSRPWGRCVLDGDLCRENATTPVRCNNFKSQENCTRSTTCTWTYGTCINAQCSQYTQAPETCGIKGCIMYNNFTCMDPALLSMPCEFYNSLNNPDSCPKGRCTLNGTRCGSYVYVSTTTTGPSGSTTGANSNPCKAATSPETCTLVSPSCMWNETSNWCYQLPCSAYSVTATSSCPDNCRTFENKCFAQCPGDMVYCEGTQTCARTKDQCTGSCSGKLCWNSECVGSPTECKLCPPWSPFRCEIGLVGLCVSKPEKCNATCPSGQVICPDLTCNVREQCGCGATQVTCPAGSVSKCAESLLRCSATCPTATSRCPGTSTCAATLDSCPCGNDAPYKCGTILQGSKCVKSWNECPCENRTDFRCSPDRCAPTRDGCANTCPSGTFLCSNSKCAATRELCPCDLKTGLLNAFIVAKGEAVFDISRDFFLGSRATLTACNRTLEAWNATTYWIVADITGKTVQYRGKDVVIWGRDLTIPAWALAAGTAYQIQLMASLGDSMKAMASIMVRAVAPTPILNFVGGNRRIQSGSSITLAVEIKDAAYNNATDFVAWSCCTDSTCATPCLLEELSNAKLRWVSISNIAVGTYYISAYYKGMGVNGTVWAVAQPVPKIAIAPARVLGIFDQAVSFYASVDRNTSITWSLNGTKLASTSNVVTIPRAQLTQGSAWILTASAGATAETSGSATIVYRVPKPLQGSCSIDVKNSFGDSASTAVAGTTRLAISSQWPETSDALRYRFFVGDLTTGVTNLKPIVPFASELSGLDDLPTPFLTNNPTSASLSVTVIARIASTEVDVGFATCQVTVTRPTTSAADITSDRLAALAAAKTTTDTRAALAAAADIAVVASSDASVNRTAAIATAVKAIADVVSQKIATAAAANAESFSRTEKAALVQTLDTMLTTADRSVTATKDAAVAILRAAVAKSSDQADLDTTTDAVKVASLLNRLTVDKNVSQIADQLARRMAAQAEIGTPQQILGDTVNVTGKRVLRNDCVNATVGSVRDAGAAVKMPSRLPDSVANAAEDDTVSLSVSSVSGDAFKTRAGIASTTARFAANTAEVTLQLNGIVQAVKDLLEEIEVSIKLDASFQVKNTTRFTCVSYDEKLQAWVNDSSQVYFAGYVAADNCIKCRTKHLSSFSGTGDDGEVEPTASSQASTAAPGVTTTTTAGGAQPPPTTTTTTAGGAQPPPTTTTTAAAGVTTTTAATTAGSGATTTTAAGGATTTTGAGGVTPAATTTTGAGGVTPSTTASGAPGTTLVALAAPEDNSAPRMAAIAGGTIGAIVVLVAVAFVAMRVVKSKQSNFEDSEMAQAPAAPLREGLSAMDRHNRV